MTTGDLTQEQLGVRAGIRKRTVSDRETGRVCSPDTVVLQTAAREARVRLLIGQTLDSHDEFGHLDDREVIAQLEAWAVHKNAPADPQGWRRETGEVARRLAAREGL